jgi:hypothetical protein
MVTTTPNKLNTFNKRAPPHNKKEYGYDDLYQLTRAHGETKLYLSKGGAEDYRGSYTQDFEYDRTGNLTSKESTGNTSPPRNAGDALNYTLAYEYYNGGKSHKAERIGSRYYRYDLNGNVTEAREGGHRSEEGNTGNQLYKDGDMRYLDYGIGLERGNGNAKGGSSEPWSRQYRWDEENRLI